MTPAVGQAGAVPRRPVAARYATRCSDLPHVNGGARRTNPTPPPRRPAQMHFCDAENAIGTYSRPVPINASPTKAARDGECGRIRRPVAVSASRSSLRAPAWGRAGRSDAARRARAAFKFITSVVWRAAAVRAVTVLSIHARTLSTVASNAAGNGTARRPNFS
ncbi:unnamed protein product, partial [Iphiclides podalirius]